MSLGSESRATPGALSVGAGPRIPEGLCSIPRPSVMGTLPGTGTNPTTTLWCSTPAGDRSGLEGPTQTGEENWLEQLQSHGDKDVVCRRAVFMPCVYYKDHFSSS